MTTLLVFLEIAGFGALLCFGSESSMIVIDILLGGVSAAASTSVSLTFLYLRELWLVKQLVLLILGLASPRFFRVAASAVVDVTVMTTLLVTS